MKAALKSNNLDAIIITNPINRRYITGFTGSAGIAIISKTATRFVTDFRYTEQATEEAIDFTVVEHKRAIELEVNEQLKELDVQTVGFEENDVTYALYEKYKTAFTANMVPISGVIENIRLYKTEEEIATLKRAGEIADAAYEHIQTFIKPGMKEIEVANELEFFMRNQGATSSSFDIIVASGYRSALPHGVASDKKIETGELVTMDYGALYNGYCSDITRTLAIGEISDELRTIYETVKTAQERGVHQIKPGLTGQEADAITRDYITDKGYGDFFGHSTGHGLGLEVHEQPSLAKTSTEVLKPGMVVTVEPGIYIPQVGGCRIEDDIVITKSGNQRLTNSTKELIQL